MIWQCLIIFINSFLHPFFHFPIKASISNVENPFCGFILNHAVNWSCFVLEPFYIVIFGVAKKLSGYFCFAAKLHCFFLITNWNGAGLQFQTLQGRTALNAAGHVNEVASGDGVDWQRSTVCNGIRNRKLYALQIQIN